MFHELPARLAGQSREVLLHTLSVPNYKLFQNFGELKFFKFDQIYTTR
jgi:hypothetical protein